MGDTLSRSAESGELASQPTYSDVFEPDAESQMWALVGFMEVLAPVTHGEFGPMRAYDAGPYEVFVNPPDSATASEILLSKKSDTFSPSKQQRHLLLEPNPKIGLSPTYGVKFFKTPKEFDPQVQLASGVRSIRNQFGIQNEQMEFIDLLQSVIDTNDPTIIDGAESGHVISCMPYDESSRNLIARLEVHTSLDEGFVVLIGNAGLWGVYERNGQLFEPMLDSEDVKTVLRKLYVDTASANNAAKTA